MMSSELMLTGQLDANRVRHDLLKEWCEKTRRVLVANRAEDLMETLGLVDYECVLPAYTTGSSAKSSMQRALDIEPVVSKTTGDYVRPRRVKVSGRMI